MFNYSVFTLVLIFNFNMFKQEHEILKSNKMEFETALISTQFSKTDDVKESKHKISIACKVLTNDDSDENYKAYHYLGSIPNALNLKVIQQENYNGNYYYLYDTNQNCKETVLNGKPFLFNNYIIANNEDETTDRINKLTIWELKNNTVEKNSAILLGEIAVKELRFKVNYIYISDFNTAFYKIKIK
jgi:hypothetical protein